MLKVNILNPLFDNKILFKLFVISLLLFFSNNTSAQNPKSTTLEYETLRHGNYKTKKEIIDYFTERIREKSFKYDCSLEVSEEYNEVCFIVKSWANSSHIYIEHFEFDKQNQLNQMTFLIYGFNLFNFNNPTKYNWTELYKKYENFATNPFGIYRGGDRNEWENCCYRFRSNRGCQYELGYSVRMNLPRVEDCSQWVFLQIEKVDK